MKKNVILSFLVLFAGACAGSGSGGKKIVDAAQQITKQTQDKNRVDATVIKEGRNSYYYYLAALVSRQKGQDEQAYQLMDQAIKVDDSSATLWSRRAFMKAEKNEWESAIADAEAGLKRHPQDADLLLLVGKLNAAKGDAQKAIGYYQRALASDRKNEETYNVMAREYLTLKQTDAAISQLKNCVAQMPEAMGCIYYLATILKQVGRDAEAIRYFGIMGELNPDNEKILENLGEVYLHQKDLRKALDVYIQLKNLNPTDYAAAIRVALIYFELKETDKAIAEFEAVSRQVPASDRMHYFLGLLYLDKKDHEQAFRHLSQVNAESPFHFEAIMRSALILKEQGKINLAISFIEKQTDKAKARPEFYDLRASFQELAGNRTKALEILNSAVAKFPEDAKLLFQRAVMLDRLNRWPDAKKDMLKLIAKNPENATALNYLGYTMVEKDENLDEAATYLEKAHALKPNDYFIADSLGWLYFKKGEIDKALMLISEAARKTKDEATIQEHLGDIYFHLKNKRLARQNYEEALRILRAVKERNPEEEKQLKAIQDKLAGF